MARPGERLYSRIPQNKLSTPTRKLAADGIKALDARDYDKASDIFAFIHESPNSIEDCVFRLDLTLANQYTFDNLPAALHNGGTTMAFLDGHTEMHRWGQLSQNNGWPVPVQLNNTNDVLWLKSRCREQ